MADHASCGICGAPDSWKHSLLECNFARCVWALEQEEIVEHLCQAHETDARDCIMMVLPSLGQDKVVRVVLRLWAIWYARRKVIHEELFQSPLSTHAFVERYISEIQVSKPVKETSSTLPARRSVGSWIAPPSGFMKVNVDAAVSKNSPRGSAAAVARDTTGKFLGASVLVVEGIEDSEVMESIACREGLALASDLGLHKFRLASDNLNVIQSLKEHNLGVYRHIVEEIKARSREFGSVEFVHDGRSANLDAHNVVCSNVNMDTGRNVWLLSPPPGYLLCCE